MRWNFDRHERLAALRDRARELETYLGRERCDTPRGSDARALIDARLVIVRARVARLAELARCARRNARLAVA